MKKTFYIIDGSNKYIVEKCQVGRRGQIYFDEQPRKRIKVIVGYIGFDCTAAAIVLGCYECYFAGKQLSTLTIVLSCVLFPCVCLGILIDKFVGEEESRIQSNKHFGSWKDPYGLAQGEANNIPGKKTYYIVDSEKNAIVDVKRLGKWGQRYVEWRGRRQKGGA